MFNREDDYRNFLKVICPIAILIGIALLAFLFWMAFSSEFDKKELNWGKWAMVLSLNLACVGYLIHFCRKEFGMFRRK